MIKNITIYGKTWTLILALISTVTLGQTSQTYNVDDIFTVPSGVTVLTVQAWGAGQDGIDRSWFVTGGGGGGGAFAEKTFPVVPGTSYKVVVGARGAKGENSTFALLTSPNTLLVKAEGGGQAGNYLGGRAASSLGDIKFSGGNGFSSSTIFGGGGGSGGSLGNGTDATSRIGGAGGAGTSGRGGNHDSDGIVPGGGGGELKNGANGRVVVIYNHSYLAQISSAETGSSTWCPGETRNVSVTIKNIGTQPWTDGGGKDFNIGVKWNTNGTSWTDYHVRVDAKNLQPGQTETYVLEIKASNNVNGIYNTTPLAGTNNLTFDVVYEGVSWFGNNNNGVGPGNETYRTPNQNITNPPAIGNNVLGYGTAIGTTASENANATLNAPARNYFSSVNFASYGTPNGTFPNFTIGTCHAGTSQQNVESRILGMSGAISIAASNAIFNDPCSGTLKRLYISASYAQPVCSGSSVNITGSAPSGGSGTYSYLWESSTTSATSGFAPAAGANSGVSYTSGALTQDTWFRRVITSCNQSSTSAVVLVKVNPLPNITLAAASASVCQSTSAQTSVLTYSGATENATTYSIVWNSTPANTFAAVTDAALSAGSISIIIPPNTPTGTYTGTLTVKNAAGCLSSGKTFSVTVNNKPTIGTVGALPVLCAGVQYSSPTPPTVITNGSNITSSGWEMSTTPGGSTFTAVTLPYTASVADTGKLVRYTATNSCGTTVSNTVSLTVNPLPTVSVTGNNQICKSTDAVFNLTGTPGATVLYNINGSNQASVVLNSGKAVVTVSSANSNQTLNIVSVSNGACTNPAGSSVTVVVGEDSVYTGTGSPSGWSKGLPNDNGLNAVIAADYNTSAGDINACNCTVSTGKTLTVAANTSLTVINTLTNTGNLIVESDGNLVQKNDTPTSPNIGDITVKRNIKFRSDDRQEYNYLISPVVGQSLKNIYPGVPTTSIYPYVLYYVESTNLFGNSSGAYIAARGLAVKEPLKSHVPADNIDAVFKGLPGNGQFIYTLAYTNGVQYGYNLVGNPYPSNIDLRKLYVLNGGSLTTESPGKISSTFYFWDNRANDKYVQQGNNYNGRAYAVYNAYNDTGNKAGYLLSPDHPIIGQKKPNSIAKVGQGFMVRATGPGNMVFNNSIRVTDNSGADFFSKTPQAEANRYWLRLLTPVNTVNTVAVVYFQGGSNAVGMDDSSLISDSSDMLYTIAESQKLQIEGRPEFTLTDKVTIGSRHYAAGNYTFALDKVEGIFASGQHIYLKDKQTGIITDLTEGSYTFASNSGESTGRFEIVYKPGGVLATDAAAKEDVMVYRAADDFVVKAPNRITALEIYDMSGRLVLAVKPNSAEAVVNGSELANGVYLMNIKQGQEQTVKKIVK